jgi:23S rRNA (adenine2030-N6)-methyltransferase
MNYRHLFHAGNFADLLKHAMLLCLLREMTRTDQGLTVIDTHAGAGLYDVDSEAARRTGEAEEGVGQLMSASDAPAAFDLLKAAVVRANRGDRTRYYPGSPVLIEYGLRPRDRYIACELRPDDHAALKAVIPRQSGALVLKEDGWTVGIQRATPWPQPLLVLIDPPFERPDDGSKAVALIEALLKRNRGAVVALWAPIKDLTTFDALVSDLQDAVVATPVLITELRLRGLGDPMRMNGCAMIVVNSPSSLEPQAREAAEWIANRMGEAGGLGRTEWRNR